jgi:hypothetical protein
MNKVSRMSRRREKEGGGLSAVIVALIVFYLVYEHVVNPYSNPVSIFQNFLLGIWDSIIAFLIHKFGFLVAVLLIAVVAGSFTYGKRR